MIYSQNDSERLMDDLMMSLDYVRITTIIHWSI